MPVNSIASELDENREKFNWYNKKAPSIFVFLVPGLPLAGRIVQEGFAVVNRKLVFERLDAKQIQTCNDIEDFVSSSFGLSFIFQEELFVTWRFLINNFHPQQFRSLCFDWTEK